MQPASIFSMCLRRSIERLMVAKFVNVPPSHALRTVVREVSGQTSIPVMVDGDVVLDDDDDIIPYLEKTYGQKAAV